MKVEMNERYSMFTYGNVYMLKVLTLKIVSIKKTFLTTKLNNLSAKRFLFQIINVTVSDSGKYSCIASNFEGEDTATIKLQIHLSKYKIFPCVSLIKYNELTISSPGWTDWSSWTPCTAECDGGSRDRSRVCENDDVTYCPGKAQETQQCNTFDCERSKQNIIKENCSELKI